MKNERKKRVARARVIKYEGPGGQVIPVQVFQRRRFGKAFQEILEKNKGQLSPLRLKSLFSIALNDDNF